MSIVHPSNTHRPDSLACAQAGCPRCLNHLISQHEGLVHTVLKGIYRYGVPYADLVQEGRIALWRAVRGFDPQRGTAFSTYAGVGIQRRLFAYITRMTRSPGYLPANPAWLPEPAVLERLWHTQLRQAVAQALTTLPPRQRHIIVAAYGLDDDPPRSLAAIGRHIGLSRERVRQLRRQVPHDALLLLRLPAVAPSLHALEAELSRADYARLQSLNRAWLRQRRGGRAA